MIPTRCTTTTCAGEGEKQDLAHTASGEGERQDLNPNTLAQLLAEVGTSLDRHSWEGVARPQVLAGTIGSDARAMGGALLPLYANFAPDRDLFLKLAE